MQGKGNHFPHGKSICYICRPGLLCNWYTDFGISDPRGTYSRGIVRPSGLLYFVLTSVYVRPYLLALFIFVLFHYCCCPAQMFWTTLVQELHIFYCHTEWNLFLSHAWDRLCIVWGVVLNKHHNNNSYYYAKLIFMKRCFKWNTFLGFFFVSRWWW